MDTLSVYFLTHKYCIEAMTDNAWRYFNVLCDIYFMQYNVSLLAIIYNANDTSLAVELAPT